MVLAILSADEGGGFGVVEDLFGLRIEVKCPADTSGDVAEVGERCAQVASIED